MSSGASFSDVQKGPLDPINILKRQYDEDPTPSKVDLGVGVLRDEQGGCYEIPVVQEAKAILAQRRIGHDYRPTTGIEPFRHNAARLIFGDDSACIKENRVATVQTVAGTGACRIGAVFLSKHWPSSTAGPSPSQNEQPVYLGVPTWGNYDPLFQHAGFSNVKKYQYLDLTRRIDMASTVEAIQSAPNQSIIVLQAVCHNPTGRDFTKDQWSQIADIMQTKGHFAFFDCAYQGLGTDSATDAWAIRHFVDRGIDMLVCQSFSKNAGLYSERVGALHVVCASSSIAANVLDQLRALTRWEVSSTPAYGAELVNIVLSDPALKAKWQSELESARQRMRGFRKELHELVTSRGSTSVDWSHLLEENGLFSFTGLSAAQTRALIAQYHIYMPENGRINVSGLNSGNIKRVAEAFDTVVRNGA
ncbi:hypothetical protein BFW01_g2793 [Lasiodiplodia theobromae]|nr:hypothetical protein BFW01_g2793 [Lasiodiplodia theobromae]